MNVVVATGGSGGHFYPALKVARELKKRGHRVQFMGSLRVGKEQCGTEGFQYIETGGIGFSSTSVGKMLQFFIQLIKAFFRARHSLKKEGVEFVSGFGSYASFPVVLAAWSLRIPVLIHEQNALPGKANRVSARFANIVAVSFRNTGRKFSARKTFFTGCPVNVDPASRQSDTSAQELNLDPQKVTIFVMGGSQGSQKINETFIEACRHMTVGDFQVIHICGPSHLVACRKKYESLSVPAHVVGYENDIGKFYFLADMLIARAGALTIHEIAAYRKPSILIPLKHAGGHQKMNAWELRGVPSILILDDASLEAVQLADHLQRAVASHPHQNQRFDEWPEIFQPHAEKNIADLIENFKKC